MHCCMHAAFVFDAIEQISFHRVVLWPLSSRRCSARHVSVRPVWFEAVIWAGRVLVQGVSVGMALELSALHSSSTMDM